MYDPKTKSYHKDSEANLFFVDIEAAGMTSKDAEIYEICIEGINNPLKLVIYIAPDSYEGCADLFSYDKESAIFLRSQHGMGYFEELNHAGIGWENAAHLIGRELAALEQGTGKPGVFFSQGMDYDFSILENLFKAAEVPCPWHYRNRRDFRTLAAIVPEVTPVLGKHTAESDVAAMIMTMWKMRRACPTMEEYFGG